MIGAAQTTIDDLAKRQVGAEMGTPGALDDRLARAVAVDHHARAEEIAADQRPRREVPRERDGIPGAVEACFAHGVLLGG
jgi:hypothetical protein